MEFIWYNPDIKQYQLGSASMYKALSTTSPNTAGFTLLYKLKAAQKNLGLKLINELNKAGSEQQEKESNAFSLAS